MRYLLTGLCAILLVAVASLAFISQPNAQSVNEAATAATSQKIPVLNDENFEATLKDSKTIIVVDFYADWCGPCRAVDPSIKKLAKEFDGQVLVVKVDVDNAPKTSRANGIRSIPTVAIFAPGSTDELDRRIGVYSYDSYKSWVENHLKDNPGK